MATASLLYHNNRDLLANLCQRGLQSALRFRTHDPQPFVTQFQLMKLQLHAFLLAASRSRSGDQNIEEERTKRR